MYRKSSPGQLSFQDFYLPFGGKLSSENRWVKLAEMIPWEAFESTYASEFSEDMGAPAKGFRMQGCFMLGEGKLYQVDWQVLSWLEESFDTKAFWPG